MQVNGPQGGPDLVNIGAPNMLDLSCADHRLPRFMSFLQKGINIRDVRSENFDVGILDFFKSVKSGEKRAPRRSLVHSLRMYHRSRKTLNVHRRRIPEHVASIFSVRNAMES